MPTRGVSATAVGGLITLINAFEIPADRYEEFAELWHTPGPRSWPPDSSEPALR